MTLITFKDGKPVVRGGKVGTAQACCCGCSCCIIDGVCKCQYTTKAACEDCDRTYECYEVVQTQCDGTCPSGFGDTPEYVAPIIITHEGYGCWGWGFYYGEAAAVIGCGEILSATITSQYWQLARLGRVAPTITAALHISEGSGAVLGVTLEQSTDGCGRKVWSVVAVNVIDGGSGYVQGYAAYIWFDTAAGDSVDFGGIAYPEVDETGAIVNVYVENGGQYYREDPSATPDVASPTITIDDGLFGSGAVITPNIDTNTSSPTFGELTSLTVEDGGSGYRALCSRTTEVTSCEDCPSHGPAPEFSSCTQTSAVGACGTWQQVDCEDVDPTECCRGEVIYACYRHPVWEIRDTPCHQILGLYDPGYAGCDHILESIAIDKPESLDGQRVLVTITGSFDDDIAINGNVVGPACRASGEISHTFTLTQTEGGFTIAAVDSYGVNSSGSLTICFDIENPFP